LKVTIIFLNGTIIFQTPTIVAHKMTSSTTCDKRSFEIIQGYIKSLFSSLFICNVQIDVPACA